MEIANNKSAALTSLFMGTALFGTGFFRKLTQFGWRGSAVGGATLAAVATFAVHSVSSHISKSRDNRSGQDQRLQQLRSLYGGLVESDEPLITCSPDSSATTGQAARAILRVLNNRPSPAIMDKLEAFEEYNQQLSDCQKRHFREAILVDLLLEVGRPNPFAENDNRIVARFAVRHGPTVEFDGPDGDGGLFNRNELGHLQYEGETTICSVTMEQLIRYLNRAET